MINKNNLALLFTFFCLLTLRYFLPNQQKIDATVSPIISNKLDKKTRADLANLQNFEMTKDPALGYVPRERLWLATKELEEKQNAKSKASIPGIVWRERGPSNVSGRTRTVLFDPNDAANKRVFAGSVSGGLWVANDIYASPTSWTAVDEFLENLAITSIAYDPTSTTTMYFGTGEGFSNSDAVRGDGIFKSTDGGSTWTQLSSTTNSLFNYTQKIVVDATGNVYAATRNGGIQKSTNGGTSWSTVLSNLVPASGTNATTTRAADIEIAANGDIYAAMGIFDSDGIYKSTNSGTAWTKVYIASSEERIELACAPSNSDYVYALTQDAAANDAENFLRTTNGGTSWTALSPPTGFSAQTWYNIGLSVDPNDETNVYTGGLDLWKSTNSGTSFTRVAYWNSVPYVHADHHIVVFAPGSSDSILFGNDGGVFLTENGTSANPSFRFQSTSYNVTQFYSGAIHPTANENYFLAGAQDNGSQKFTSTSVSATTEVTGGDGGFVFIDQNDPTYQFTSYTRNQYARSTNGGQSFSTINISSTVGKFINPTDYDNDAFVMYTSYGNGTYLRWTDPRTGISTSVINFSASGTGEPSALFCDPNTANRLYIGTDDGEIWRINNANTTPTASQITGAGMLGYVSSIDVEDGDATHLLATFSSYGVNQVWESTNSGTSWTVLDGTSLPDMPIRWGMFSPLGSDSIFLATELGVWTTDDANGASTVWGASNSGLANVRTDMLQWRDSDSTLIAATHGRGLFSTSFSKITTADFASNKQTIYSSSPISFFDASIGATSWAWDFDNDGTTDATTQNPSWTYTTGGYKTVTLEINGSLTATKTNYITVIPNLGTPYTTADGGNFESNGWHFGSESLAGGVDLWELGAPSNAISNTASGSSVWKTDLDADIAKAGYQCALYSPSFNMTASGSYTLGLDYRMEAVHSQVPIGVYVEYSIDGGILWTQLGTYDAANNWYSTSSHLVAPSGICWSHSRLSYTSATVNASALAGNSDVRFRVVTAVADGWNLGGNPTVGYEVDGFSLDNFSLSGPANDAIGLPVETNQNATATANLGPNETVNFISANNKILATIQNLSTHNYGATTVTVDNAGTSTQNFSTNTATSQQIMDKTLTVIPTTNNASGSYQMTTYFTNAEASAWKSNTSQFLKNFNQIKSPNSISSGTVANTVYGTSPSVDSTYNGSELAITATYNTGFSGFGGGLTGSAGPLPAELIAFYGEREGSRSLLHWETASELNTSTFEIERLNDTKFEYIGSVGAAGNSRSIRTYIYGDNLPSTDNGKFTYRLKIVDHNEEYEYSNVLVLLEAPSLAPITIFPSPAKDVINIQLSNEINDKVDLKIINIKGEVVKKLEDIAQNEKVSLTGIQSGTHFILFSRKGTPLETRKILIIK